MGNGMALYKYNPVLAGMFHFTETALKANGRPTARYHKYSLILNPARSVTKEAEVTVMVNIAEKKMGEEAHLIKINGPRIEKIALSSSTTQGRKLQESIKKVDSESAHAVNIWLTAKLIGGNPQVYEYSVTGGKGATNMEHKWNLHMETVAGAAPMVETANGEMPVKMMCVEGRMTYPSVPSTGIKWKHHIGFGESCEEFAIRAEGSTAVSDKQKQYSKISPEAKLCDKMTIEAQKLRNQLKYMTGAPQKSKHQHKFAQIMAEQVRACSIKENQAFALDQAVIEVTTSETLPTFVYTFGKLADSGLKAVLFPYIAVLPGMPVVPANKVVFKLNFNQKLNTVSMHVQSPRDTVVFKNIRLPVEAKHIFPLIAKKSPIEQSYEAITGSPLFGKCILGQGFVQTFDKKTYGYQVDACDHIITSDCSKEFNHAVLAKEINGQKHITVFHMKSKISLIPSVCVTLYNGKDAKVEDKNMLADGSQCGLCGDYNRNQVAEITSAKGCVYSSPYASALSYRSRKG